MKVALIIPSTSKGRTWISIEESYLYENTMNSFLLTYNPEHNYTFYIGIDKNDPVYDNEVHKEVLRTLCHNAENVDIKFIYMDGIESGHLTVMWNRLFESAYNDGCNYFFQCGDDIEFKTKHWVNDCISTLKKSNDVGLTGPINNNPRILTQSFVSRKHMELFGYYFPSEIINWFCDDWINGVYKEINRFYPLGQHLCINMGGNPRYRINNGSFTNQREFDTSINRMTALYKGSVRRDVKRIKGKL